MASPLPTITVTGKFVDLANQPANGSVIMTPLCRVAGKNWLISGRAVRAYVRNGQLSTSIINNSDLLSGSLYVRIDERIEGDPTHRAYVIKPQGPLVDLSTAPQLCAHGPGTPCCNDFCIPSTALGQPGGVATLGPDGLLSPSQRPPGSGGGVTVHGQLLGLDADDHKQYYNAERLQAALTAALAAYLPLTGGTLTGPVSWAGTPTTAGELTNKQYVDAVAAALTAGLAAYLPLSGGTLTGPVSWSGTPTTDGQLTNKQYVDAVVAALDAALTNDLAGYLPLTGGTITGPVSWGGTPTLPAHLATKSYVDSVASGGVPTDLPEIKLFDIEDYGADPALADNYQAILDTMQAVVDYGDNAAMYVPPSIYRVQATEARLGPDPDQCYAVFPLPMVTSESGVKRIIGIVGAGSPYAVRASSSFGAGGNPHQVQTASTIKVEYSTPFAWDATNGHPSVFGFPDADATGHFEDNIVSNVHFVIDKVIIRQPDNPSLASLNLELVSTRYIGEVRVDVDAVLDNITLCTHPTGVAILDCKSNNNVAMRTDMLVVEGYYAGIPYTEHADIKSAIALRCRIGVHNRRPCSHIGYLGMIKLEQCLFGFAGYDPTGLPPALGVVPWIGGTMVAEFVDVEYYAYEGREGNPTGHPEIYTPLYGSDIYAPEGRLTGSIRSWNSINAEPPPPTGIGVPPFGAGPTIYLMGNVDGGLGISSFGIYYVTGEPITLAQRKPGHAPETPATAPPDAPTIGPASAGVSSAFVTFTPAGTGQPATSFTATSTPGGITASAPSSPITVPGLTPGVSYTFTVHGTNTAGDSPESAASNNVVPFATAELPRDSFDRADQVGLGVADVGGPWLGTMGQWGISGNKAVNPMSGVGWQPVWLPVEQADMVVQADITWAAIEAGIFARAVDEDHLYYLDLNQESANTASGRIYIRNGTGSFTGLGTPFQVNGLIGGQLLRMKLACQGSTITAYVNKGPDLSIDTQVAQITDTAVNGTHAGIGRLAGADPVRFDDFRVTAP